MRLMELSNGGLRFKLFPWVGSLFIQMLPISRARNKLKSNKKQNIISLNSLPRLLIDVSVIIQHDAGTGIQRVVRTIWKELRQHEQKYGDFILIPVYATRKKAYRYVDKNGRKTNKKVIVRSNDIFLGLDWSAHILTANEATLYKWKMQGVRMHFVLYDFLPLLYPEWFTLKTVNKFKRWLRTIVIYSDSILSISNTVQLDLSLWLRQNVNGNTPKINIFPLGGDFFPSLSKKNVSFDLASVPAAEAQMLENKEFFLTVGTLEPRKGHKELLSAFEYLWERGYNFIWVIVGRPGWHTEEFQQYVLSHPNFEKLVYWYQNVDDVSLDLIYKLTQGVIVPSKGEGYGLPVIEALSYKKKVLVRDLPVFREIAGDSVTFFEIDTPDQLGKKILDFRKNLNHQEDSSISLDFNSISWSNSVNQLVKLLMEEKS